MRARLAEMEGSARVLTVIKLANVALSMLWGFAVTYVFVRVLPEADFRAFLLLVAFNNFTISAEFGLTNIIYARLRRFWLENRASGNFRVEEIGALFVALLALIGGATVAVGAGLAMRIIPTAFPLLFLLFFLSSALNVQALLVKRALAAVDRNLIWEALDLARRLLSLVALLAALAGLDLMISVGVQLVTSVIAIGLAIGILHRVLDMQPAQWLAWRVGGGHMRSTYLRDISASAALTISEIIAYNAPYFTIAAMSHDTALLLLFDFVFKMSRAVSTAIRATIEAVLPRITRAFFAQEKAEFARFLQRAGWSAMGVCLAACALLVAIGQHIFGMLFGGRAAISISELLLVCVVLIALGVICLSVYVQGALGRFGALLRRSLPFLAGSLLLMPVALALDGASGQIFMVLYALLFVGVSALHMLSLRQLVRAV